MILVFSLSGGKAQVKDTSIQEYVSLAGRCNFQLINSDIAVKIIVKQGSDTSIEFISGGKEMYFTLHLIRVQQSDKSTGEIYRAIGRTGREGRVTLLYDDGELGAIQLVGELSMRTLFISNIELNL